MIDPGEQTKEYQQQLEQWLYEALSKIGTRKEFLKLTANFRFDRTNEMSSYTLSRTLGESAELPTRRESKYNLYAVLGVLYLLQILDRRVIETFLQTYDITPPKEDQWGKIWEQIDAGASQGQRQLETIVGISQSNLLSSQSIALPEKSHKRLNLSKRIRLLGALLLVAFGGLGFVVLWFSRSVSAPSFPCLQSDVQPVPTFLPDQGYSQIHPLTGNGQSSIPTDHVRSVAINSNGLWVGYIPNANDTNGVSIYDGKEWKNCTGFPLVAGQNVNDFAFKDNDVFVATDGAGIGKLDNSGWRVYTTQDGLPSNIIYDLLVDRQGNIWAATDEGVTRFVDDKWQVIYQANPDALASNHVHEIFIDDAGNFWFGFRDRGISRLSNDNTWQSFYTDDPNFQKIRGIVSDNQGGVWFATEGGVLRYYKDHWTIFTASNHQIPSDSVQDVEQDKFGRIWAATSKGVVYTSDYGQTWTTHSTIATLDIVFGCPTCIYNEDHLWLALNNQGVGHVRIPPQYSTVRFTSIPKRVQLHSGTPYIFQVEVQALSVDLLESEGDSLRAIEPNGSPLYGAWPIIPVLGKVQQGQTYTFSNTENPITAPDKRGIYTTSWRVWQGRRFASEPIIIEFEVIP